MTAHSSIEDLTMRTDTDKELIDVVKDSLADLKERVGKRVHDLEAKFDELAQKSTSRQSAHLFKTPTKDLGHSAIQSDQVKSLLAGQSKTAKVTLEGVSFFKSTVGDTGSPATPDDVFSPATRLPNIAPATRRVLRVADLLVTVPATSNQVSATVEGATINSAAGQTSEGATKGSTDFVFELKTRPVITVAHIASASEQVLSDAPALAQFLNTRMTQYLNERYEFELLRGDGSAGQFSGFTASGNHTAFTPATGDTALDSIRRAAEAVETAGFFPDAVVMHPSDWRVIELLKASTGEYLAANGAAQQFITQGMSRNVWGLRVVVSPSMVPGKFVLADFGSAAVHFARQDAAVELGWINDNFARNLVSIRCEARGALIVTNPLAVRYGDLAVA
jgi:HK97 family phage major capsid protein